MSPCPDLDPIEARRTPAWRKGWDDANDLKKEYNPGQMDAVLYLQGWTANEAAAGITPELSRVPRERAYPLEAVAAEAEESSKVNDLQTEWSSVTVFDPPILFDPVKVPAHYNRGQIEVANFIADQQLPYPLDNIVKYACRAGHKEGVDGLQDLEKMAAYLQMAHNIAMGKPAVVRDPETKEVVWTLFRNEDPRKK